MVEGNLVNILVGGTAGSLSKTVMSPFERVKILQQTGGGTQTSCLLKTVQQIWHTSGPLGFWRGNVLNCIRVFPSRGIVFGSQSFYKQNLFGNSISGGAAAGSLAGLTATIVTYPMDMMRTRFAGVHIKEPIHDIMSSTFQKHGLAGFYRGLSVTVANVLPYSGLMFGCYEMCRSLELHPVISGATSGIVSGTLSFPLDTVRRILQASGSDAMKQYDGGLQIILRNLYSEGGFLRFFRGAGMNVIRIGGQQAVVFGSYESIKKALQPVSLFSSNSIPAN